MSGKRTDSLAALALAGIFLYNEWLNALDGASGATNYYIWQSVGIRGIATVATALATYTALFLLPLLALRSRWAPLRVGGWLVLLVLGTFLARKFLPGPLALRCSVKNLVGLGDWGEVANRFRLGIAVVALLYFLQRYSLLCAGLLRPLLASMGLFPVILLLQLAMMTSLYPRRDSIPAAIPGPSGRSPIVVVLFDEWDQHFSEAIRAQGSLPELSAVMARAVTASNAYPPCSDTLCSVPAYLGDSLVEKPAVEQDKLLVTPCGKETPESFAERPSLFQTLRAQGHPYSIVGFFHRYCRTFGADARFCFDASSFRRPYPGAEGPFTAGVLEALLSPFQNGNQRLEVASRRRHDMLLDKAVEAVGDLHTDFYWLHMPIPHPLLNEVYPDPVDYAQNLRQADAFLARLRARMGNERWERSTLLLISDHWWRAPHQGARAELRRDNYLVPFIVRLPEQKEPLVIEEPFNTVILSKLVLALAAGTLKTPDEVKRWIVAKAPRSAPIVDGRSRDREQDRARIGGRCGLPLPVDKTGNAGRDLAESPPRAR